MQQSRFKEFGGRLSTALDKEDISITTTTMQPHIFKSFFEVTCKLFKLKFAEVCTKIGKLRESGLMSKVWIVT